MGIKNIIDKEIYETEDLLNHLNMILTTPVEYLETISKPSEEIKKYLTMLQNLRILVHKQISDFKNFKNLIPQTLKNFQKLL